jgi:hypothetical protein
MRFKRGFLEFIVHAPFGKHETRYTIAVRIILERWMPVLVALLHVEPTRQRRLE